MKLRKSLMLLLILTLALGTVLAACGGGDEGTQEETPDTTTDTTTETKTEEPAETGPKEGGTVTFSMFSAPEGSFNPVLYGDAYEANVIEFVFEGLVGLDENLAWEPNLAKDWSYENENKTLVMELRDDVLWHDGEEFTANDVKFTYEFIGHPDYTGVRGYFVDQLVGAEEYRAGEAEELAGIEVTGDYQVKFHFKEPNILALRDASFDIIPEHVYSKYPIGEQKEAAENLEFDKLIGTGPFKATEWLAGEYYTLSKNENYWDGAPLLDTVVWRVVNQDVAPGLLANGDIDIITSPTGVRASDFEYVSSLPGIKIHETPAFAYQYLGFKLNHRTAEDVENNVIDPANWVPNEKLQSVELRQAMAYAIDRQGIVDGLLEGHGTVMNAPFPPVSWAFDDSAVNKYEFGPDKANELLDGAGFKDVNGDGFREDQKGEELTIRLDYPTGNKTRELSAPIIKEQLEAVGLRIDLRAPREAGSHFNAIDVDEPGMDMYLAGWSLATADPDPSGIWATTAAYNYNRWNNEKSEELRKAAIKFPDAFDQEYRKGKYKEWATHINEQLPSVFLYSANEIFAYNTRIQNVQEGPTNIIDDIQKWYITE
jgi:peptide/nickel transport system substrate-binding protein